MSPNELIERFRSDVVDVAAPYLWTEDEVQGYQDDAYRMFARLTGGIADFTSEATLIDLSIGERVADLHKSILHIEDAYLLGTGRSLKIINLSDPNVSRSSDYGLVRQRLNTSVPGPVRYMLIGRQKHKCEWVDTPEAADQVQLTIHRMPLKAASDGSLDEIDEDHHIHLLNWMKHLAYMKQDAETFDKTKSENARAAFEAYCDFCRKEWSRYKHKTRVVAYGGL